MSGALFLGITTLISLGAFLNGVRFARMSDERLANGRFHIEMPAFLARNRTAGDQVRLLGRLQIIFAPIFLLFSAALSFGLLGPVEGIQTIQLVS